MQARDRIKCRHCHARGDSSSKRDGEALKAFMSSDSRQISEKRRPLTKGPLCNRQESCVDTKNAALKRHRGRGLTRAAQNLTLWLDAPPCLRKALALRKASPPEKESLYGCQQSKALDSRAFSAGCLEPRAGAAHSLKGRRGLQGDDKSRRAKP